MLIEKNKIMVLFAVLIFLLSSISMIDMNGITDAYSDNSTKFTYKISADSNASGQLNSLNVRVTLNGTAVSEWGFDEDGYGPFGSFYAAFDSFNKNKMVCHLNPDNLSQSITQRGTDKTLKDIDKYNIMWVLPTLWWKADESGNLLISNHNEGEMSDAQAYAHTIKNGNSTKIYNYLAIGVFEAS